MKYFETLYKNNPEKIDISLPVFIKEIAIIKDTVDDEILLRNTFANIGTDTIIAISVEIYLKDVFDEDILFDGEGKHTYLYQDIEFKQKTMYGNTIAIPLPYNARKAEVWIDKIVLADGSVCKLDKNSIVEISEQHEIQEPNDFLKTLNDENEQEAVFYYIENSTCWQCTCGHPNRTQENICQNCGRSKEVVKSEYKQEIMKAQYEQYAEEQQRIFQAEQERIRKEQEIEKREKEQRRLIREEQKKIEEELKREEHNKRVKKYVIRGIAAFLILVIGTFIIKKVSYIRRESKIETAISNKAYDEALQLMGESFDFWELYDQYGDSVINDVAELDENTVENGFELTEEEVYFDQDSARNGSSYMIHREVDTLSELTDGYYTDISDTLYMIDEDGKKHELYTKYYINDYIEKDESDIFPVLWSNEWIIIRDYEDYYKNTKYYAIKNGFGTRKIDVTAEYGFENPYYTKMIDGNIVLSNDFDFHSTLYYFNTKTGRLSEITYKQLNKLYNEDIENSMITTVFFELE